MTDKELLENNKKVEAEWKAYLEECDRKEAPKEARRKRRLDICTNWQFAAIASFACMMAAMFDLRVKATFLFFGIFFFCVIMVITYDDTTDSSDMGPTDSSDGYF